MSKKQELPAFEWAFDDVVNAVTNKTELTLCLYVGEDVQPTFRVWETRGLTAEQETALAEKLSSPAVAQAAAEFVIRAGITNKPVKTFLGMSFAGRRVIASGTLPVAEAHTSRRTVGPRTF